MKKSKKRTNKNIRKSKEIKVIYKYIGDKGSENDKLEAEQRVERVYNMLFKKIGELKKIA